MMRPIRSIFHYVEPLWQGSDNKMSLKNVLVIFFSWKLVENLDYGIRKWEAGKSLSDLAMVLGILAALIAGLLGITIYSNLQHKKIESASEHPQPAPVYVGKAENVSAGSNVESANVEKVETINTQNVNVKAQDI